MKHLTLIFGLLLLQLNVYSQNKNEPIEVTPLIEKKIKQECEKEVNQLKARLITAQESATSTEFILDTFRIEIFTRKYIAYDYSTVGMRTATYDAAEKYDSLLNKYYKRLLIELKGSDKQTLIQAQKAWITFRDNEMKLITTLSKDEYSGGGTMQGLIEASEYLDIIRHRTITIYQHLTRGKEDY